MGLLLESWCPKELTTDECENVRELMCCSIYGGCPSLLLAKKGSLHGLYSCDVGGSTDWNPRAPFHSIGGAGHI